MYAWMRRHVRRGEPYASTDEATPGRRRYSAMQRRFALIAAACIAALATIVFPASPAHAAACSLEEWKSDFKSCVNRLTNVSAARAQCLKAPVPDAPDSGLAGWFAARPESSTKPGAAGKYSEYGYAGYAYTTYDIEGGCASTLMHPDYKFENTIANGEFMLATAVIGASNALRERAWDPGVMWGWADPLVEKATQAIYKQVFTVFGAVTLAVVGIYLLWRSRQAEMSAAMTTAAWALLVMVVVTALASWPVFSAHLADKALVSGLSVVHDAVGPPTKDIPADQCELPNPEACNDNRPPAVRASDTAVETLLYRNWLRGLLGSADSTTAQKYGEALYNARSFTWGEVEAIRSNPQLRDQKIKQKNEQWLKVAEQIKTEDPEAYQYLTGVQGMDRIGAGFIALLSSILFAMFDLTASLLVLLGFLIFRWAVIAAPVLGTVGLLRPASAGFKRLVNAVVAAIFNIVIFGTGAAIYLFAVDLIMSTATLAGWLQVVLIWLCGVVGWLLLRPYRRITQLGGKDSTAAIASAGTWHRRFLRDARDTATLAAVTLPASERVLSNSSATRTEQRPDGPERPEIRQDGAPVDPTTAPNTSPPSRTEGPRRRVPAPGGGGWSEPAIGESAPAYTVYRPSRSPVSPSDQPVRPRTTRAEARRD